MKNPASETFPSLIGPVRMTIESLHTLRLLHLISGLHDDADIDCRRSCGRSTTITGYTEWVDGGGSPATLGWDWEIKSAYGQIHWRRLGLPFTNLLLVGSNRQDLPWQHSLQFLAARVDSLAWAESTRAALRTRYAGLPGAS